MAGSVRQKKNGKWLLDVSNGTTPDGKRDRRYKEVEAKDEEDAKRQLAIFEHEIKKGTLKNDGRHTVESYAKIWLKEYAEPNYAIKTTAEFKKLLPRIYEALGHIRLSKLKASHLTKFYNMLREDGVRKDGKPGGLSENTISHYHRLMSIIFETAIIESDFMTENPCKKVKKPPQPKPKNEVTYYDQDETIRFLNALDDPDVALKYKVALNLIIFTSSRRGEVLGIEWPDINFETGEVSIERESQYLPGIGIYTDTTKNDKSTRANVVPEQVVELLKQYQAWQNEQISKCGDKWVEEWKKEPRLFTQWNGKPMHPSTLNHWLSGFLKKNDIKLDHITPHGLRHTYATLLIGNGVDIATVSENMGHANKTTTLNIYTGVAKKKNRTAADALEKVLLKSNENTSENEEIKA